MKADAVAEQVVQQWPLERLTEYAGNPRKNDHAVEAAAAAIRQFGFRVPILVRSSGEIVDGHLRLKAARHLGLEAVPVLLADDMSEQQVRAFRISVNKVADLADWDMDRLAHELDELRDEGFDLPTIGFTQQELNDLIGTPNTGFDPDETPPVPVVPVSRTGDLWILGDHRLLCGDSTKAEDVARLMGRAKAVVMNTDPPYGIGYDSSEIHAHGVDYGEIRNDEILDGEKLQAFLEDVIRAAVPHLADCAAFYLWHPMLTQGTFFAAAAAAAADILIHRQIIWIKPVLVFGRGDYHWKHELCFYGWRRGHRPEFYGERNQTTVWEVASVSNAERKQMGHATPKPVELFIRPLKNHTKFDDVCYEPFAGSGPQIIAAEMTGRRCCAMEIAPQYVDVCVMRWQAFTGREATLDGRTFDEVRAARQ